MISRLIISFILVASTQNTKLPSNFLKCNRKQPDIQECLLKAAQNGVSQLVKPFNELNIPSLDPFELPGATIGAGRGVVALIQKFKNCKLYGLHTVKINKFRFNFENRSVDVAGSFSEIKIDSDYEFDGNVLLLPIKGKGPSTIILQNLRTTGFFTYEEKKKKKGKTYFKFLTSDVSLDPGKMSFRFENLFEGDKRLGESINQVLNDNWSDVFEDIKDGYQEIVEKIMLSLVNNFFSKVSVEEAFD